MTSSNSHRLRAQGWQMQDPCVLAFEDHPCPVTEKI